MPQQPLQLFGAAHSYYTGKTRAHLLRAGITFEEVLSTKEVMKKFLIPTAGTSQVPVLFDPNDGGRAIIDTSKIFDHVDRRYCAGRSFLPATPVQRVLCYLVEAFSDAWLVLPAMHYRWSFPSQRAWLEREWGAMLSPDAPLEKRLAEARRQMQAFGGSLPALGVNKATVPDVEAGWAKLLAALDAHLARHDFVLGGRPSLADVALMGPLFAHLYRDPVPGLLMRQTAPHVAWWVERMNGPAPGGPGPSRELRHDVSAGRIAPPRPAGWSDGGEFFAGDAVPDTLRAVAAIVFDDFVPAVRDLRAGFEKEVARRPKVRSGEKPIPRMLGFMPFRAAAGGAASRRMMQPLELWKLQRAADAYAALPAGGRRDVDAFAGGFANGGDLVALLRADGHTRIDLRGGNAATWAAPPAARL